MQIEEDMEGNAPSFKLGSMKNVCVFCVIRKGVVNKIVRTSVLI